MIKRVAHLFLIDLNYRYEKKVYLLLEFMAELFALWVLYKSSKVLLLNSTYFEDFRYSYFDFVFVAEMILRIPSLLTRTGIEAIKFAKNYRVLYLLMVSPKGLGQFILDFLLSRLAKEVIKIVFIFTFALLFFDFSPPRIFYAKFFFITFLFFPFFLGLGFLSSWLYLIFGRGENLLMKGFSVLAVLSGLYFPTTIYSEHMKQAVELLSPIEYLIKLTRLGSEQYLGFSPKHFIFPILGFLLIFIFYPKIKKFNMKKIYEFDYKI